MDNQVYKMMPLIPAMTEPAEQAVCRQPHRALTTNQSAQFLQTAFGHNIEYFCFFNCLLDRERGKALL